MHCLPSSEMKKKAYLDVYNRQHHGSSGNLSGKCVGFCGIIQNVELYPAEAARFGDIPRLLRQHRRCFQNRRGVHGNQLQ